MLRKGKVAYQFLQFHAMSLTVLVLQLTSAAMKALGMSASALSFGLSSGLDRFDNTLLEVLQSRPLDGRSGFLAFLHTGLKLSPLRSRSRLESPVGPLQFQDIAHQLVHPHSCQVATHEGLDSRGLCEGLAPRDCSAHSDPATSSG